MTPRGQVVSAFPAQMDIGDRSLSSRNTLSGKNAFQRRNNSTVNNTLANFSAELEFGNFGHSVSKVCPKNFTLTPVDKLEPMGYDMNKLPKDMRITSNEHETDIN